MFKSEARFLIVDDSEVARDLVRSALTQLKLKNVDEAIHGQMAWDRIQKSFKEAKPYALVFCDINMPEMDGLKLLETARAHKETEQLPFLMITTEGAKPMVIRAVMAGVAGYMVKPFGIDDVKKKIKEIFERISQE